MTEMVKKLINVLTEYLEDCKADKRTTTFRGLIDYLDRRGVHMTYFDAQTVGLLEFNNAVFNIIEKKP